MVRNNKSSSFKFSTRFFVVMGILIFAIIVGTIVRSSYKSNEGFTGTETQIIPQPNKTLIYLYMETCGFCNEFNKIWNEIADDAKATNTFKTAKYDLNKTEEGKKLAIENKIDYAPALVLQEGDKTYVYDKNTRDKGLILSWVNSNKNNLNVS